MLPNQCFCLIVILYLFNDLAPGRAADVVDAGVAERSSFRKVVDVVADVPPVQRLELACWKKSKNLINQYHLDLPG